MVIRLSFTGLNGVQLVRNQPLLGDIDNDGWVNVSDLILLITHWSGDGHGCDGIQQCIGDLNGDLRVDADDLIMLILAWTA